MSRRMRFDRPKHPSHRLRLKPPKDFSSRIIRRNNSKEEIAQAYDHQSCLLEAAERKIITLYESLRKLASYMASAITVIEIEHTTAFYDGTEDYTRWLNSFGALGWRLCALPNGGITTNNHVFARIKPPPVAKLAHKRKTAKPAKTAKKKKRAKRK